MTHLRFHKQSKNFYKEVRQLILVQTAFCSSHCGQTGYKHCSVCVRLICVKNISGGREFAFVIKTCVSFLNSWFYGRFHRCCLGLDMSPQRLMAESEECKGGGVRGNRRTHYCNLLHVITYGTYGLRETSKWGAKTRRHVKARGCKRSAYCTHRPLIIYWDITTGLVVQVSGRH